MSDTLITTKELVAIIPLGRSTSTDFAGKEGSSDRSISPAPAPCCGVKQMLAHGWRYDDRLRHHIP